MKPGTVVVGYCDGGSWSAIFGMAYRDLLLRDALSQNRIIRKNGKELRAVCGTGGLPAGRNQVARDFLDNTDGEWLFVVDTDMGFGDDTVDRLIGSADQDERPIMGGLCFQLKRKEQPGSFRGRRFGITPTLFEYIETEDEVGFRPMLDYNRDSVCQVAGTGSACVLIHRTALEKIRAKYQDTWYNCLEHPTGDGDGGPRTFSEDLSFCVRAQAVGIPIHVDTSVKTTHDKLSLFLDEELYDASRPPKAVDDGERDEAE